MKLLAAIPMSARLAARNVLASRCIPLTKPKSTTAIAATPERLAVVDGPNRNC